MEMRIISTRVHGILDYVMGLTLTTLPALLSEDKGKAAKIIPMFIGGSTIAMSLMTDYELSLSRKVPMNVHLTADLVNGLLLAASPWLFGFSKKTFAFHLAGGLMEVAAALMTKKSSIEKKAILKEFIQKNFPAQKSKTQASRRKAVHA